MRPPPKKRKSQEKKSNTLQPVGKWKVDKQISRNRDECTVVKIHVCVATGAVYQDFCCRHGRSQAIHYSDRIIVREKHEKKGEKR